MISRQRLFLDLLLCSSHFISDFGGLVLFFHIWHRLTGVFSDFLFGSLGWLLHLVGWKEWRKFIGREGLSYEEVPGWKQDETMTQLRRGKDIRQKHDGFKGLHMVGFS
ncbi:hypothetical protein EYC84_005316 [Monilinia fructicola]|uniref:Uncharacterized protein n=1 Tax=Monilinia fructicola TaxID=38448 RepID=A0A5M9K185_MONFR|nr:hypothetical protein EYC84_005316 [Monilinia fructicola]